MGELTIVDLHAIRKTTTPVSHRRRSPRPWQRFTQATRLLADRAFHQRRFDDAQRRLRSVVPDQVLIVCYGNLCRSPYLQGRLRQCIPDVEISSCGFAGNNSFSPPIVIELSAQRGVDLSRHRSRPVTQTQLRTADLVVVMEPDHVRTLASRFHVKRNRILVAGDLDPRRDLGRGIEDPINQSIPAINRTLDRLDRCADTLARIIRQAKEA